jgi:hypothetical protein
MLLEVQPHDLDEFTAEFNEQVLHGQRDALDDPEEPIVEQVGEGVE